MKKDIYAGIALGILVGGIIGLSIAQVTGIILGALTSLLAAFFGLRPNNEGETGNQMIIGTFSIACLFAIFGGLYIRTNNLFSPSLEKDIKLYQEAKFTSDEIKQIILVKKLGLIPKEFSFVPEAKSTNDQTVLMAGDEGIFLCNDITENSTLTEIKLSFDNSGGKYQKIEQNLSEIISDTTELRNTLLYLKDLICEH